MPLGIDCLLEWMFVFLSISWISSIAFKRRVSICMIYSGDSDANGFSSAPLKLLDLPGQIANNPIYLLNHRLCEDLHLYPDLCCSYLTSSNDEAGCH